MLQTMIVPATTIEILLVEDNPADVDMTRLTLQKSKLANRLSVATNGAEALSILRCEGAYAGSARPDMILLDLNMPGMNGLEVLQEIKDDPQLRAIPVIILTSSRSEEDVVRSYNRHANCFISKPVDLAQFVDVVSRIEGFWFSIVKLPPRA